MCLKTPCRSGVQGDGSAATLYQGLHQQEVIVGVLLLAEDGVDHRAGGIVHGDQQRERRYLVAQPRVMTAVHLDEHARARHALAAHPVLGWPPLSRTAQTGVDQDTPQGRPADFDALSFAQQLAEMGVVGPCVPGACQVNHIGRQGIGSCVGRPAAPMTVGQGGCASFPVNRQHAPGVAWADTHQRSGLVQRHMLRQQAVQNLKSRLFFGGHCHILHRGNVTFMLAS